MLLCSYIGRDGSLTQKYTRVKKRGTDQRESNMKGTSSLKNYFYLLILLICIVCNVLLPINVKSHYNSKKCHNGL